MQAITEVINKSHYGNSHLQMRRNPVPVAEHSGRGHGILKSGKCGVSWPNTQVSSSVFYDRLTIIFYLHTNLHTIQRTTFVYFA